MGRILQKIRLIGLSQINDLLDHGVDLNSLGAVRVEIGDLEDAMENIGNQAADAQGHVASTLREIDTLTAQIAEMEQNIELLLNDDDKTNDASALSLQRQQDDLKQKLETAKNNLEINTKTAAAMENAVARLRSKHDEMMNNLNRLQSLDEGAKAQTQAAEAMRAANAATSSADNVVSIDSVSRRIQERADAAEARFNREVGRASTASDDIATARAKAAIAARLAKKQTPAPSA